MATPAVSFEIDAAGLQRAGSRKPRHLALRMSDKKRAASPGSSVESSTEELAGASSSSASQHSHASASQKRQQLLAQRRQHCGERVRHAKSVASKQHSRRERDVKRLRSAIDERQWTTDFRRQALQRVPRSKLMDGDAGQSVAAELIRTRLAAKRIQRWWKVQAVRDVVRQLLAAGVVVADVGKMPIEALMVFIQSESVIQATSRFLLAAKKSTRSLARYRIKNPTKIFLSAFMIVHHPEDMFPEMNDEQKTIQENADKMLALLATVQSADLATLDTAITAFAEQWHAYHVLFEAWKARDTEKLLAGMFEHFMQLEQLWESVRGKHGAEIEWKPRIDMQQKSIKAKVMRIGGKAALGRLLADQKEFRNANGADSDSGSASGSPASQRVRHDSVTGGSAFEAEVVQSPVPARAVPAVAAPAPAAASMQEMAADAGLSNMAIAHEMIMDPDFELKGNKDALEYRIAAMAKKAFFDKVREDMAQPGHKMTWAMSVIADLREQLLSMVDEKGKVHAEIAAVLDMALIEQQIEAGVYDIENCLRFVSSKMLQLCAPVRDAAIRELATLTDIPSAMQAMLSILDDMKLDLANYRLLQLRPHLMKQAVEYEQSKFQSALDEGVITLAKTTEWLQAAAKMAQEVADARNPEGIAIPDNRVRFQAVYYDALLALLFGAEPLMRETVPETLIMDAERMSSMQNELQAMSIVGALVLLSQQVFPQMRGDAALLKQLKAELLVLLEAPDTTVEHIAALIVSKANVVLERTGKPAVDEERVKLVESMVNKTMSLNDTIYSLINRRMRDAIRAYLVSGKWSIGPNSGLDMVAVELEAIAAKTMRLGRHNAAVHEPQYNEVIRTALNL